MSSSSPPPSPPPSGFTRFARLPPELQDLIWGFALPRRTVYLHEGNLRNSRLDLPRHRVPAIAQVSRNACAVATRTGRWLYFGASGRNILQRYKDVLYMDSCGACGFGVTHRHPWMRKRMLWFDAARDTLLVANLRLWPQDQEANPVAIEIRLPIPGPGLMSTCDEGDGAANNKNKNKNKNNTVTYLSFSLDNGYPSRQPCSDAVHQTWCYFPRFPPPEGEIQPMFASPTQDIPSGEPRLWPCPDDGDDCPPFSPLRTTPAGPPSAYTESVLDIAIERPLAASAHAEFFPEGSTACFIDLSALEPLSSSPPHLSSYYSDSNSSSAKSPANPHNTPVLTRQALVRLLDAYTHTQDLDKPKNEKKVELLQRLVLEETGTEAEAEATMLSAEAGAKEGERSKEAFFPHMRRGIAFKWLRSNWKEMPYNERRGPYMAGAVRCCGCERPNSPSSPLPWTSLLGQSRGPETPTSAQPSIVYRMPRPWAADYAHPYDFNLEHPWTRKVLEDMPRLRLGLLLRLEGEAAARAAGVPNAHW